MFVSSKHDVVSAVSAETRMHGGPADRAASDARLVASPDGEIVRMREKGDYLSASR
jgi:hypothetical protein